MGVDSGPHGWLIIDKPLGLSSNGVVELIRRSTGAKAGHAGTLDPLATGVLPIAIGEATKTTSYAMVGRKRYRFRIRWGVARTTDDREGEITGECASRPSRGAIDAILPHFIGAITQLPPAYSAVKVNGRRAYALARADAMPDSDHADCEALVGKGTYIRALARDLGTALGTFAHIAELRRLSVGRFTETQAITLDLIGEHGHISQNYRHLLPIEAALDDIPAVRLTEAEAARLRNGQSLTPGDPGEWVGFDELVEGTIVSARYNQALIALARIEDGRLRPIRVMNC